MPPKSEIYHETQEGLNEYQEDRRELYLKQSEWSLEERKEYYQETMIKLGQILQEAADYIPELKSHDLGTVAEIVPGYWVEHDNKYYPGDERFEELYRTISKLQPAEMLTKEAEDNADDYNFNPH